MLDELAEATRETVNLGVLSGESVVYVDQVTGTRAIVTVSWVGQRTPLHCTSNGKVLLAYATDGERDRLLSAPLTRLTPRTITDVRKLRAQLAEIRARGYAQTMEELEEGLNAVAAPVRGMEATSSPRSACRGRPSGCGGSISRGSASSRRRRPSPSRGVWATSSVAPGRSEQHAREHGKDLRPVSITWDGNRGEVATLLDAIGRTPLVRLQRVAPPGVDVLAKVEWYGPTGSVKDRIYAAMLAKAEERGDLKPGMTIIECTTGNAGIACSAVAAIKGYRCTIVMPEGMSNERKTMIRAYGADLVLTPGAGTDIDLALERMREIVAADPDRYFFPGEFENPDNPEAQLASGEEIWEQAGGRVDAVVGAQGTGGWISGVAHALKARNPSLMAFAVEPAECPLITEHTWGTHGVPGIGDGIVPPNLDLAAMDGIVTVSTEEALVTARRLAREEGLLCGPSSGINVAAVHKVIERHPDLHRVVTVICDTGQRYLSGELYGEKLEVEEPERDHTLDPATVAAIDAHRDRLEFIA